MISSQNDFTHLYCSQNLLLPRNTLRNTFLHWIKACTQIRTDDSLDIRYCTISSKGAQELHSLKRKKREHGSFRVLCKVLLINSICWLFPAERGSCFAFPCFLSSLWEESGLARWMLYPQLHSATLIYFINLILNKCSRTSGFDWESKAKTRVIIATDQSKQRKQHKKPMITRKKINKLPKAREKAGDRVVICLGFLIVKRVEFSDQSQAAAKLKQNDSGLLLILNPKFLQLWYHPGISLSSPISSCCTFRSCSIASLSALIVSTCSISFLSSCTAGLEAEEDDEAPTLGMAAANCACNEIQGVWFRLSTYKWVAKRLHMSQNCSDKWGVKVIVCQSGIWILSSTMKYKYIRY